jgi:putative hydrolase of HD superfamily
MHSPTISALLALQALESLPRTGWIQRGVTQPESIADHILGTCYVALALGPRLDAAIDVERVLALVLVHDAPEALLGDLPRTAAALLPQGAKASAERRAAAELLPSLSPEAHEHFIEYSSGASREARFARVCDRLQLGVKLLALRRSGARGLEDFVATLSALDCSEFAPAVELQTELLDAIRACP